MSPIYIILFSPNIFITQTSSLNSKHGFRIEEIAQLPKTHSCIYYYFYFHLKAVMVSFVSQVFIRKKRSLFFLYSCLFNTYSLQIIILWVPTNIHIFYVQYFLKFFNNFLKCSSYNHSAFWLFSFYCFSMRAV